MTGASDDGREGEPLVFKETVSKAGDKPRVRVGDWRLREPGRLAQGWEIYVGSGERGRSVSRRQGPSHQAGPGEGNCLSGGWIIRQVTSLPELGTGRVEIQSPKLVRGSELLNPPLKGQTYKSMGRPASVSCGFCSGDRSQEGWTRVRT